MALCVALTMAGTLEPTGESVEECTGYVLVSGSEHSFYALAYQAFATPTPEQAAGWFVGSFGAVLVFYVAAWMVGTIVAMFKTH
jgi:hypothetical protein